MFDAKQNELLNARKIKDQIRETIETEFSETKWCNILKCKEPIEFHSERSGPAIKVGNQMRSNNKFYGDLTFALKCYKWPDKK